MNEEEVIRAIVGGDVERFREIYNEYRQYVVNFCYSYMGSKSAGEQQVVEISEVVQMVFVELYKALPRFRFESKFSTFVTQIAINTMCNMMKHHSRYFYVDDQNKMEGKTMETYKNVETEMMRKDSSNSLHKAIGQLQHEQRTAIILYSFEDFSYKDIAEVMGCTLTKVETLIFRAKKKLRIIMEKQ